MKNAAPLGGFLAHVFVINRTLFPVMRVKREAKQKIYRNHQQEEKNMFLSALTFVLEFQTAH